MNIRSASLGDLDALLRLYEQLSPGNAGAHPARACVGLDAILAAPFVTLLVAEDSGTVVGTVTLVIVPNLTHDSRPWAQVENMVTDASVRGTGAGRLLIEECLRPRPRGRLLQGPAPVRQPAERTRERRPRLLPPPRLRSVIGRLPLLLESLVPSHQSLALGRRLVRHPRELTTYDQRLTTAHT